MEGSAKVQAFSVRWSGMVQPRYTEPYTFTTTADDGVRLWVNGELLIDDWSSHAPEEHSGTTSIALTAGQQYTVTLEYFENLLTAEVQLEWESIHQAREIVPTSQLYPRFPSNLVPSTPLTNTRVLTSTHDGLQRLTNTQEVGPTATTAYSSTYDLAGNRLAAWTNGSQVQSRTYDGTNRYVYGRDRLFGVVGSTRTWYNSDGLGSVCQTLDDAGVVQQTQRYDAWGVPQGAAIAPFGYTGELQQGNQVYLRARWYNAGNGAFGSRDSFAGRMEQPYSLHPMLRMYLLGFLSLNPQPASALIAFSGTSELRGNLGMGLREFSNDGIDSFSVVAEADTRIGYQRLAKASQFNCAELGHDLPDLIPQMGLRRFQWRKVALNLAQIAPQ
jgi:hypothetical protein